MHCLFIHPHKHSLSRSLVIAFRHEPRLNAINVTRKKNRTPVLFRLNVECNIKMWSNYLRHDFCVANVEQRRARHPGNNIIVTQKLYGNGYVYEPIDSIPYIAYNHNKTTSERKTPSVCLEGCAHATLFEC